MQLDAGKMPTPMHSKGTEPEIRRLLRLIKRRHLLEASNFGKALAEALKAESVYDAVITLVDMALPDRGYISKRLRELVLRCDVLHDLTQAEVASSMHLSPRQFFRYRFEAVAALAAAAGRVLQSAETHADPVVALAKLTSAVDPEIALDLFKIDVAPYNGIEFLDALLGAGREIGYADIRDVEGDGALIAECKVASSLELRGSRTEAASLLDRMRRDFGGNERGRVLLRFEMLVLEFLIARHSGSAYSLADVARQTRAVAADVPGSEVRTKLMELESHVKMGDHEKAMAALSLVERSAWEDKNIGLLGVAALRRAQIEFLHGNQTRAHDLAYAALVSLRRLAYDSAMCRLFVNRVRLLSGIPVIEGDNELFLYTKTAHLGIRAREALRFDRIEEADALSREQYRASSAAGFRGLQAWASATLGAVAFATAQYSEAEAHCAEAWAILLETGDALLARDLFAVPGLKLRGIGPLPLDARFEEQLRRALEKHFPNALVTSADFSAAFTGVLSGIIRAAVNGTAANLTTYEPFAALLAAQNVKAQTFGRLQRSIIDFTVVATAPLMPIESRANFRRLMERELLEFYRVCGAALSGASLRTKNTQA